MNMEKDKSGSNFNCLYLPNAQITFQASLPLVTNPSDTRGDPLFRILGLKKKDAAISLSFDLVGDELLDIIAPDE